MFWYTGKRKFERFRFRKNIKEREDNMQKKLECKGSENLLDVLHRDDGSEFRPVVFWSVNSCLKEDELRRQLHEMKSYGLGGVIFHARAGMTTEYFARR